MKGAVRKMDKYIGIEIFGKPCCPHNYKGFNGMVKSYDKVKINGKSSIVLMNKGKHFTVCGPNIGTCIKGSTNVKFGGKPAHRKMDKVLTPSGRKGKSIKASTNVFVN